MAVVIDDKFGGEAVDVNLDAHTPDTTGTGWTLLEATGNDRIIVSRTGSGTPETLISEIEPSDRALYTAQGTYTSNEYDVEIDVQVDGAADDPFWFLGRVTDSNNYYGAGFYDNPGNDVYIVKKVSSTVTTLASADTDFGGGNWAGDSIKFEIRDAAKKIFADSGSGMTELLSDTDNAITATGEAGLGTGNIRISTDDMVAWRLDNFLVTEVAAAGGDGTDMPWPIPVVPSPAPPQAVGY